MVLADETLYVAGPSELLALTGRSISEQNLEAAYDGKRGSMLWAVSAQDGSKLAKYELDSPPVFDGPIAAHGCPFMTTMDGRIQCLGEK